jgi:multiple sugar transport system permease protein
VRAGVAGPEAPRAGRRWRRLRAVLPGYAFTAPAMAGVVVFGLAPLVYAFVVSLQAYDLVNPHPPFVGLGNYARLLADPVFWDALRNTLTYAVMLVPLQTAAGLGLALLIQQPTRWVGLFRTAYFMPVVISYVVAAGLWQVLFATPNGPMNSLLALFGIPPQLFFLSRTQALPLIAIMSAWKWSGVSMLVYLGGLHEIPVDLYEAARVDGAGALRQFADITWPLLRRVTLFVVVVNTIDAFKIFTPVYVITQGGPMDATMVLVFHLFREGFRYFHLGYASAVSFVLLLLVLALAVVEFRVLREAPG